MKSLSFLCEVVYNFAVAPPAPQTSPPFLTLRCHPQPWHLSLKVVKKTRLKRLSSTSFLPDPLTWGLIGLWHLFIVFTFEILTQTTGCSLKKTLKLALFRCVTEVSFWNHHIKASVKVQRCIKIPTLPKLRSSMWHLQITHLLNALRRLPST